MCLTLPLKVLSDNKVLKKLLIGYANICSSIQTIDKNFETIYRFWMNKRKQRFEQKGSLKVSEEELLLKT